MPTRAASPGNWSPMRCWAAFTSRSRSRNSAPAPTARIESSVIAPKANASLLRSVLNMAGRPGPASPERSGTRLRASSRRHRLGGRELVAKAPDRDDLGCAGADLVAQPGHVYVERALV